MLDIFECDLSVLEGLYVLWKMMVLSLGLLMMLIRSEAACISTEGMNSDRRDSLRSDLEDTLYSISTCSLSSISSLSSII